MCNTWTYTHIAPHREIVFEHRFADESGSTLGHTTFGFPAGIPAITPHRVMVSETAGGGTVMTIEETGYGTAEAAKLSRQGFLKVLDKLARVVE